MSMTLEELAIKIGATVQGDGSRVVSSCASLDKAGPDQVSFLANPKYSKLIATTQAGAVILGKDDAASAPSHLAVLVAKDPYFAFRQAVVELHGFRKHPGSGISPQAVVHPTAKVGKDCIIHPFVVIEEGAIIGDRTVIYPHCYVGKDARVGDDCQLYANVTVYDDCVLGNRVTLHAGCVIGQDGFGYATYQGKHHKIPQAGIAVVEDDVEMGAGCTIDRATIGVTRIGAGTKFSDLVAIGHGASIGRHNLFVAQVGIAGSTETGDYVVMGGQVGVAGHLRIGNQVKLAAKSGVMDDIPDKSVWGGQPAVEMSLMKRSMLLIMRLPDIVSEFRKLQRRVNKLEESASSSKGNAGKSSAS
jgi:UDP-3-O-[3-hydroxymyristoyl] glucosamine N-acyltransferase